MSETIGYSTLTLPKYLLGIAAPSTPTQTTGTATVTLPLYSLEASNSVMSVPSYTLAANGVSGAVGSLSERIPALLMASAGSTTPFGSANLSLPSFVLVADGVGGTSGGLYKALKAWAMESVGGSGTVGGISLQLPSYALNSGGSAPTTGIATLTLPMFMMEGYGSSPASTTYTTLAMNSNTAALTSYDNFPFNSMTTFNGVTLAAGDNGIYALGGTLDDTTQIISTVRLGIFDFGSDKLKRVDSCYFAYRSDGDLTVRVTLDDDTQYEYTLESTGQAGIYTNRLKLGKGCQGRYFQAEIESFGNPFVLDSIDLKAQELSRRI